MMSLTVILSAIDVNSADSIAKMVSPDADVANPFWWIATLIAVGFGILYFLLKHYLKIKILDGRPKPCVRILEDGQKREVVYLSKTSMSDIDNDVARQVKTQMDIIDKKYPMISIDPYNDPRLMLKSNMTAARHYNADVMDYMDGMQRYYGRVIKDRLMSERYKRIDFSLMAKGRKACSSLNIEMSIKGDGKHVYSAGSRELKKDKHDVEPENNEIDRSSDNYAFFPNKTEEYEYGEWLLKVQPAVCHYTCENLVSGCPNVDVISPVYVDTCYEQNVVIGIKINGADIPEGGIMDELVINVG